MRRWGLAVAVVLLVAVGGVAAFGRRTPLPERWPWSAGAGVSRRASTDAPTPQRIVPESVRVVTEVFNAAGAPGLARLATLVLRDAGFDVVLYGTATPGADGTRIVVRRGAPAWGDSAAAVLGGASVTVAPDTSRQVDLSVFIGPRWRPPPGPLRP